MFTLISDRNLREKLSDEEYINRLNIFLSFGECMIIVRDNHDYLNQEKTLYEFNKYLESKKLLNLDSKFKENCTFSLSGDFKKFISLKNIYNLGAIHMKHVDFLAAKKCHIDKLKKSGVLVGTSVHSADEFKKIEEKNPNYILVSPIFQSKCKIGVEAIEESELEYIIRKSREKNTGVYGLGGIGYVFSEVENSRYPMFSNFAIRSLFYESKNLKSDLEKIVEVAKRVD